MYRSHPTPTGMGVGGVRLSSLHKGLHLPRRLEPSGCPTLKSPLGVSFLPHVPWPLRTFCSAPPTLSLRPALRGLPWPLLLRLPLLSKGSGTERPSGPWQEQRLESPEPGELAEVLSYGEAAGVAGWQAEREMPEPS